MNWDLKLKLLDQTNNIKITITLELRCVKIRYSAEPAHLTL